MLPRFLCPCERAESPFNVLPSCVFESASTVLPAVCPLESLFDLARNPQKIVPLLPYTFMNASIHRPPSPELTFLPERDVTTIRWTEGTAAGAKRTSSAEITMPRGMSDVELRSALEGANATRARVLHLEDAELGIFGGFESTETARDFEKKVGNHLLGGWSATWCCTSNDKPRGTLQFKRPLEYTTGNQARLASRRRLRETVPKKRKCYFFDATCNDVD